MATTKTPTAPNRKALHAYVTDEAHDAWHDFAATNGVSVSALLEVMAFGLAVDAEPVDLVTEARRVDAERRRRTR